MKQAPFFKKRDALTMTEVLLVVALFSALSIAVFQTFVNGIKIWDYGTVFFPEEDIVIFFDKLEMDLHNAFLFSLIEFQGSPRSLEFATRVFVPSDPQKFSNDTHVWQIGKSKFFFDPVSQRIYRQMANYGLAIKGRFLTPQVVARNIRSLNFRYFYQTDQGLLQKDQAQIEIPSLVMVDVEYLAKKNIRKMTKMIRIPIGQ